MPTFSQLSSGNWRVQVRRAGVYRAATFPTKAEARDWATQIESQARQIARAGYAQPPKGATLADLIDKYNEMAPAEAGKTKIATLAMLRRELGHVTLANLSPLTLRDFIDKRVKAGAGGVTIAADLSFLSAVLKWGRYARRLDLNERLALDARASLVHRGLNTRGRKREREPTDDELQRLYEHWRSRPRLRIDMETMCRFALASGMRLGEICRIEAQDVDREARTIVIRDRKDPRHKKGNDQKVPLLPEAWAILLPLIEGRDFGFIFPVRAASASTAFTRACDATGIEGLVFHDLRHRATAEFFRMGLQIPQVALITGHKTWAMLRRYTDVKPADVHAALARAQKPQRAPRPRKVAL